MGPLDLALTPNATSDEDEKIRELVRLVHQLLHSLHIIMQASGATPNMEI
jgi:hypothetical protein